MAAHDRQSHRPSRRSLFSMEKALRRKRMAIQQAHCQLAIWASWASRKSAHRTRARPDLRPSPLKTKIMRISNQMKFWVIHQHLHPNIPRGSTVIRISVYVWMTIACMMWRVFAIKQRPSMRWSGVGVAGNASFTRTGWRAMSNWMHLYFRIERMIG